MPEPTGLPARNLARVLHMALTGGLLVFGGICLVLERADQPGGVPGYVAYAPLILAAVMFAAALFIRGGLLDDAQSDEGRWWQENLSRVLLLWSLFEGPALFGAAIYLATGHPVALGATAAGFVLLMFNSPDRLRDS